MARLGEKRGVLGLLAVAAMLAACGGSGPPGESQRVERGGDERGVDEHGADERADPEASSSERRPSEPASSSPAPGPAESEAEPPAPPEAEAEIVPGRGACRVDDDCVLTRYQEGCCVSACEPYASSQRDLARRQAAERCEERTRPCPPPGPCRPSPHRYVRALCADGTCAAERVPR